MDRVSIAIAVYVAFSGAVVAGIWSIVRGDELAWLSVALSIMLVIGFGGAWVLGGIMKLPRGDRITMLFFRRAEKHRHWRARWPPRYSHRRLLAWCCYRRWPTIWRS
jgi:hypothetical protein